jgi:hypothetical protein
VANEASNLNDASGTGFPRTVPGTATVCNPTRCPAVS